jgi:nucleotidyltransferase/DNA polymerase involved in DNA repair
VGVITHPLDEGRVFAASEEALAAGIQPGLPAYQARQLLPEVLILPADEHDYHTRHSAVESILRNYSSRIETVDLGEWWLELDVPGDEHALVREVHTAAHRACGLAVRVGLANGKFTAQQAARVDAPWFVIPPGADAQFLAPLPITVLPHFPGEFIRRLELLDLHTLGDLAGLSRAAMLGQFGPAMGVWHDLARGRDARPLRPDVPPLRIVRGKLLSEPTANREVVWHVIRRLCQRMSRELEKHGYQAEALKLSLQGESGEWLTGGQAVKPPGADFELLTQIALVSLGRLEFHEPIARLELSVYPLRPWHLGVEQAALTDAAVVEKHSRLHTVLATLIRRFGDGVLRIAALVGSPIPLKVKMTLNPFGRPKHFELGGQRYVVLGIDEHWREEGRWWAKPVRRDYFRVVLPNGTFRHVFQDLGSKAWFLDRAWLL